MVILLFITLVKANPQASLHQQEQKNEHHLNPINDAAAKEEAAKLQSKRTLLGPTQYIPRHVGIHPLGFKYLLGYGPIGHYNYARPLSFLRPAMHTGGWRPMISANVPVFRPIKPILPIIPAKSHFHVHSAQPVQPVVNIQPVHSSHHVHQAQPAQPAHPVQSVVPVAEPEAVVPVQKQVPEPVVPITPVHHIQQQIYPFYKPLINTLIPQSNLVHQVHHIQPHLVPQQVVPQPHLVPQNLVPHPHFVQQPHLVQQPHFIPQQQHFIPQQQHFIPQQQHFIPQSQHLIPQQQHFIPQQHLVPQPQLIQPLIPQAVRPLIPQPVQSVHPVQHLIPQQHVPQNPVVAQVPLSHLPPPILHILKAYPHLSIFKNAITPLYPVNPQPAAVPPPNPGITHEVTPAVTHQFGTEIPHPFGHPSLANDGVTIQFPQHIPEYQPQIPQQVPDYPQNVPESPHLHPDTNSDHNVNQPDFSTNQHGQSDPVFIPQPRPVHPHPQIPQYLPPHPVFRPGVANPVGPSEPTNSVQTEFSATYPRHHLLTGVQHPAISLEPPYGPATQININKH